MGKDHSPIYWSLFILEGFFPPRTKGSQYISLQEPHIKQITGQDVRMVRIGAGSPFPTGPRYESSSILMLLVEADLGPSDHADPH